LSTASGVAAWCQWWYCGVASSQLDRHVGQAACHDDVDQMQAQAGEPVIAGCRAQSKKIIAGFSVSTVST